MKNLALAAVFAAAPVAAQAATIVHITDETVGGAVLSYTQAPAPGAFSSSEDIFGWVDAPITAPNALADESAGGSDTAGIIGELNDGDRIFGVVDLTNGDNPSNIGFAEWVIDIFSFTDLAISIDVAAMGDFETSNDFFGFSVAIDDGPLTPIFSSVVDEAGSFTYALDSGDEFTLDDPLTFGGRAVSNDLSEPRDRSALVPLSLTSGIAGVGSQLTLRFDAQTDGGSEAFAFDDIILTGNVAPVPLPATVFPLLAAIFGLGVFGYRRRTA